MFDNYRVHLKYAMYFDEEIAEYLLEQDRYCDYTLDVYSLLNKSFTSLMNFIKRVKYPQMLKFTNIEVLIRDYSGDLAPNILYNLLEQRNINSKWIDFNINEHQLDKTQKLEYWKKVDLNK